jgi:hypothetical protein
VKDMTIVDKNKRGMRTTEMLTWYKKKSANSTNFELFNSHFTLCGLTVNRSEMPNFSYTHPTVSTTISMENCIIRMLLITIMDYAQLVGGYQH